MASRDIPFFCFLVRAMEGDEFFRRRLEHLRQSREMLHRRRKLAEEHQNEAMASFRRMWSQLREDFENVQAIKALSTDLLSRIADSMSVAEDVSVPPLGTAFRSVILPASMSSVKCRVFTSFSTQAPSRPIGRNDFIRQIENSNSPQNLQLPEDTGTASEQEQIVPAAVFEASNDKPGLEEIEAATIVTGKILCGYAYEGSSDATSEVFSASAAEELLPDGTEQEIQVVREGSEHSAGSGESTHDVPDHAGQGDGSEPLEEELSPMEKASALCTLFNNMQFWEEKVNLGDDTVSVVRASLVSLAIAAARDSQKRLFKLLECTRDHPRPAICCAAICELVKAFPPQRLLPQAFLWKLFQDKSEEPDLSAYQDSEAVNFWGMLMAFSISLMDEHGNTVEHVSRMLLQALLPCMNDLSSHSVEDPSCVLQEFLASHLCKQIMHREAFASRVDSTGTCSSFRSRDETASSSSVNAPSGRVLKLETPSNKTTVTKQQQQQQSNKGLWNYVVKSFVWKKPRRRGRFLTANK